MNYDDLLKWAIEQYTSRIEEWKPITGFEGLYEVSTHGRIKSLQRVIKCNKGFRQIPERIITPNIVTQGKYFKQIKKRVLLYRDGYKIRKYIHSLVAMVFLPNPENKPCVDHICGTDGGDGMWNLRWCTKRENNSYDLARLHHSQVKIGNRHPMYGVRGSDSPLAKPVNQYHKNGKYIRTFGSIKEAKEFIGSNSAHISDACNNKRKYACGYVWRFATGTEFEGKNNKV